MVFVAVVGDAIFRSAGIKIFSGQFVRLLLPFRGHSRPLGEMPTPIYALVHSKQGFIWVHNWHQMHCCRAAQHPITLM